MAIRTPTRNALVLIVFTLAAGCGLVQPFDPQPQAALWCRHHNDSDPNCLSDQLAAAARISEKSRRALRLVATDCGQWNADGTDYQAVETCWKARNIALAKTAAALAKVRAQPLEFEIDAPAVADTWGRAQSWIARHSTRKIQTVTDFLIETYGPQTATLGELNFAYQVVRSPLPGGRSKITVSCSSNSALDEYIQQASDYAHLLALYMATGEE